MRWPRALVATGTVVLSLVAASAAAQGTMQGFGGIGAPLTLDRADHVGLLGIWARPVSPAANSRYGLEAGEAGAVVVRVSPGAAGDRNGLRAGDVITAIDDLPLEPTRSLHARVAEVMPTTELELSLLRSGTPHKLKVDLLAPLSDE